VLASALWRHGGDGTFDDLEERLLHALAETSRVMETFSPLRRSCRSRRCRRCRARQRRCCRLRSG
jgi:hypothetical protein